MDIVVADLNGKDITVLPQAVLELSYGLQGSDSTFTLVTPFTGRIYENCRIYVEGTEYGGLITGYKLSHTQTGDVIEYQGYSWQGLLTRRIVNVPSGQDRYSCSSSVYSAVSKLFSDCGVDSVFTLGYMALYSVDKTVELPRYCTLAYALTYYLDKGVTGNKYSYQYEYTNNKVRVNITQSQAVNVDERLRIFYTLTKALIPVNHLVCLGRGKLKDREVIHLYANANGDISTSQTFTGLLENAIVYDYGSVEEGTGKLEKAGRDKFKEYLDSDSTQITLPDNVQYNVGDVISVTHPQLGVTVSAQVTKKVARIAYGKLKVTYTVGKDKTKRTDTVRDYE